ncbi:DEAD/DEAH box helicase [Patescibacteria group bacterium]|nr:DEAD/DEAH box helicase [Patescibacteria group bacterium]
MLKNNLPNNLSAQAYFIANLPPTALNNGVLWYLTNAKLQPVAQALLKFFIKLNQQPIKLFNWPENFIDWLATNQHPQANILTLPAEYLNLSLPNATSLSKGQIILKVGQIIKPLAVLNHLQSVGYQPGPLVDQGGWFVKKGGLLQITDQATSWLISWNNNTIENIQQFNLETESPLKQISAITLAPLRLTADPNCTIKNFLKPTSQLIAAPINLDWSRIKRLNCDPLQPSPSFTNLPRFGKQWDLFYSYLQNQLAQGQTIKIITAEPIDLKYHLQDYLNKVELIEAPADLINELTGFKDLIKQTIFLTDREIIGLSQRQKTTGLKSYEKISAGDYLVHIDHGIGRFEGLNEQTVDGLTREYFALSYADDDKLYVPIEHTDRLSRYLGNPHPKLQRLSSASWWQITKKVKAEAMALASELLQLYAQRQQSQTKAWQQFPEEEVLAASFPWPLTADQLKTWQDITADLEQNKPMDRLICGDVGFGKTELAVRASLKAILNGYQVALLAPTTILAQQHFDTFSQRLKKFPITLGLLTRAQGSATIKQIKQNLTNQKIDIAIGTHALLSNDVIFKKLGLLVIDEEQRFGVKQKDQLKKIRPDLHVISLSATPIPRTLNLALANIRDLSLINTPPSNRLSIKTLVQPESNQLIKQAITLEINRGGQVFYLVNRIKDLPAVQNKLKKLLPHLTLGVIHGQMSPKNVADTMHRFDQGQLSLLLATAMIEHGLDFPNVNTLLVEKADRFGLADLYQLRGRVGRSSTQAYAYFLIGPKPTSQATNRLNSLLEAESLGSGLSLALKDIELRGAGAILGKEQHGNVSAVGLHLYGQLLQQAVAEIKNNQPSPTIPEVMLRLPLEARLSPQLNLSQSARLNLYQKLAAVRQPNELLNEATTLLGRPLNNDQPDQLLKNLLTLLEIKLLAEQARLREVSCQSGSHFGQFILRWLEKPSPEINQRLKNFDPSWRQTETGWQAHHPLAAGAWLPWLKESLRQIKKSTWLN